MCYTLDIQKYPQAVGGLVELARDLDADLYLYFSSVVIYISWIQIDRLVGSIDQTN